MDISDTHPAFAGEGHVQATPVYRDAIVARALDMLADEFADLPRETRLTEIALFEIRTRIEALERWEVKQRQDRERAKSKTAKPGRHTAKPRVSRRRRH